MGVESVRHTFSWDTIMRVLLKQPLYMTIRGILVVFRDRGRNSSILHCILLYVALQAPAVVSYVDRYGRRRVATELQRKQRQQDRGNKGEHTCLLRCSNTSRSTIFGSDNQSLSSSMAWSMRVMSNRRENPQTRQVGLTPRLTVCIQAGET